MPRKLPGTDARVIYGPTFYGRRLPWAVYLAIRGALWVRAFLRRGRVRLIAGGVALLGLSLLAPWPWLLGACIGAGAVLIFRGVLAR